MKAQQWSEIPAASSQHDRLPTGFAFPRKNMICESICDSAPRKVNQVPRFKERGVWGGLQPAALMLGETQLHRCHTSWMRRARWGDGQMDGGEGKDGRGGGGAGLRDGQG